MKKLSLLLVASLLTSSITLPIDHNRQELINRAQTAFDQFKKEINEYWKCLKRDADCDPKKTKQLVTTAKVVTGAIALLASGIMIRNWITRPEAMTEKIRDILKNVDQRPLISFYSDSNEWSIVTSNPLKTTTEKMIVELLRGAGYSNYSIEFRNIADKKNSTKQLIVN